MLTLPWKPKDPSKDPPNSTQKMRNLSGWGESGIASIEMIPILVLFVLLVNFSLGFFGAIHSGILYSIAARNYAFETFRNRSHLYYLRDDDISAMEPYRKMGYRFHAAVQTFKKNSYAWFAIPRPIRFTENEGVDPVRGSSQDHNEKVPVIEDEGRTSDTFGLDEETGVNPVWIKIIYGICLNSKCEGNYNL